MVPATSAQVRKVRLGVVIQDRCEVSFEWIELAFCCDLAVVQGELDIFKEAVQHLQ